MTHPITAAINRRYGGPPGAYAGPPLCPLCRAVDGTRRIHGTDRKVCAPCAGDIPTNMHVEVTA